jgi:hypothetical protein
MIIFPQSFFNYFFLNFTQKNHQVSLKVLESYRPDSNTALINFPKNYHKKKRHISVSLFELSSGFEHTLN